MDEQDYPGFFSISLFILLISRTQPGRFCFIVGDAPFIALVLVIAQACRGQLGQP